MQVVGSCWSVSGQLLSDYFEGVPVPESDALSPKFAVNATVGQGNDRFDDSTATLMFEVRASSHLKQLGRCAWFWCSCRWCGCQPVVTLLLLLI